jgi:hypothetical protein
VPLEADLGLAGRACTKSGVPADLGFGVWF